MRRIKIKIGKIVAKSGPTNWIRRFGLRLCGYALGRRVYVGEELIVITSLADRECKLSVGDRVSIAPRVTIVLASHANWSRVNRAMEPTRGKVTIAKDAWIGTGVILLPGVTIGESAVVGAGSLVNRDVPPYSISVGSPAKVIRMIQKQ